MIDTIQEAVNICVGFTSELNRLLVHHASLKVQLMEDIPTSGRW